MRSATSATCATHSTCCSVAPSVTRRWATWRRRPLVCAGAEPRASVERLAARRQRGHGQGGPTQRLPVHLELEAVVAGHGELEVGQADRTLDQPAGRGL